MRKSKSEGIPLENITGHETEGLPENAPQSYMERRQNIKLGIQKPDGPKPYKGLRKIGLKKQAQMAAEKEAGGDSGLDLWFEARRSEMTGTCCLCGGKSQKDDDATYRHSIHHLLEKRPTMFPSVATHPDNFLEVCFYGNSCHSNLHNATISWDLLKDSHEWAIILEKFLKIYPYIAQEERKNIPDVFLPYIK